LRKLLGHADAIRQSGGALSLNEKLCWVDAFAFERQIVGSGDTDTLRRALQLYRGEFLDGEDGSPWFAPFREHLKARFTDAIGELGGLLEEQSRIEEAATLYLRGVEADNLVESFYQGLMRCHDRLGKKAEAINVYRRLRDILSITLGIEPSFRSRQMFDDLRKSSTTPIN
jgi:DNA-binding SARP family transcriptional activator